MGADHLSSPLSAPVQSQLGVCQWFHYEDYSAVEKSVALLEELGVRRLRTGVSWADFHRSGGQRWYDWQMRALDTLDVLLSVWHTPPSIAEGGTCSSPPRCLADYAGFIAQLIERHGERFEAVELWNEPNNRYKWDFARYDPHWRKFGEMVRLAAFEAKRRGMPTVLGGMIPVDPAWLELMRSYGALEYIDVLAVHAFPGMWGDGRICWESHRDWHGWDAKLRLLEPYREGRPVWITETGFATWDPMRRRSDLDREQIARLNEAVVAPAERLYWYCLSDLDPRREAIEGFHVDEHEYHLGLVCHDGPRKPAFHAARNRMRRHHRGLELKQTPSVAVIDV